MHLADRMQLGADYSARAYRGKADHPAMADVLASYREHHGDPEYPTVEQLDVGYAHLQDCDPATDIAILEHDGAVVGYSRVSWEDLGTGVRDCVVFAPTLPDHLSRPLFDPIVGAQEAHMRSWADAADVARYRAYASHPGQDEEPTGEAAWLEQLGYTPTEWEASLVRPNLDDIPERSLPEGVEVRPVTGDQIRPILAAHFEAFRGEWDFHEPTEEDYAEAIEDPDRDETLWKVAWAGDTVVGQVKPFINRAENDQRGYLRGYTEYISTHHDWRNRGIAGTLLAMSLRELRDRGMTEAALGADTNNAGGSFHLYQRLGFELQSLGAVYTKPAP
ncbi:MAG: GNAT family N-acetyltransferase [Ilumatobacter sp.]|nr:GNAT family N-acetyltransferase [Ilumatobacter sp.]